MDDNEACRRVLRTEMHHLGQARSFADLIRWRDRLVAELLDPTSEYSRALGLALVQRDRPNHRLDPATRTASFLAEWSDILVAAFRRLQNHRVITAEENPDKLATLTLAAVCGGALIAATAKDQCTLTSALDMALHRIGRPAHD